MIVKSGHTPPSASMGSRVWCLFLLCLLILGCGAGKGELSGKVSYKGKNLATGTVLAIASDGTTHYGEIAATGDYSIKEIPAGLLKLSVSSTKPGAVGRTQAASRDRGKAGVARDPKPSLEIQTTADAEQVKGWFAIPEDYGNPATAKLATTINKGPNKFDIPLK